MHADHGAARPTTISNTFVIRDGGEPDLVVPEAEQHTLEELPDHVLVFLLGSRYCDTDCLMEEAGPPFGSSPLWGWVVVQVRSAMTFIGGRLRERACHRPADRLGRSPGGPWRVSRLRATLRSPFCPPPEHPRALSVRAILGDIGVPADPAPMDFICWFRGLPVGRAVHFSCRQLMPRVGGILMGRGRDVTHVALSTSFCRSTLAEFKVTTDSVI